MCNVVVLCVKHTFNNLESLWVLFMLHSPKRVPSNIGKHHIVIFEAREIELRRLTFCLLYHLKFQPEINYRIFLTIPH